MLIDRETLTPGLIYQCHSICHARTVGRRGCEPLKTAMMIVARRQIRGPFSRLESAAMMVPIPYIFVILDR